MKVKDAKRVSKGMKFRSNFADSNPLWEVIARRGNGVWECKIVNEPITLDDGRVIDSDWVGKVDVFDSKHILACVNSERFFKKLKEDSDNWFETLKEGDTYHYCNGFGQYVRCKVVTESKEKKFQPIALVGKWKGYDLPHRSETGEVRYGYHAQKIVDGKGAWQPSTTCVYEHPDATGYHKGDDPRKMEEISLEVPEMTSQEKEDAELAKTILWVHVTLTSHKPREAISMIKKHLEGIEV